MSRTRRSRRGQRDQELEGFYNPLADRIVEGDCRQVLGLMPDQSIDLVITSLPIPRIDRSFSDEKITEFTELISLVSELLRQKSRKSAIAYIYCGGLVPWVSRTVPSYMWWPANHIMEIFRAIGWLPRRWIAHDRISSRRSWKYKSRVGLIGVLSRSGSPFWAGEGHLEDDLAIGNMDMVRYRTSEDSIPERLYESFILDSSPPGGVVVDPFCSHGNVVEACLATGRRYVAIDRDPAKIEEARKRERQMHIQEVIDGQLELVAGGGS